MENPEEIKEEKSIEERVVVIALDESEHSARAFNFYLDNVSREDDKLILIHCYLPPNPPSRGLKFAANDHDFWDDWREKVHNELTNVRGLLFSYEQKCEDKGIKSKSIVRSGKPGQEVLQAATDNEASMIVIGSRGQNKIRRTILGSVSDYIIHHSKVPVAVIPPGTL